MEQHKPRRLRLIEPGFDNYTGLFGLVDFENGVSTHPVAWREANLVGAIVRVVDADDETRQISPAAELERMRDVAADAPGVENFEVKLAQTGEIRAAIETYSREELEQIADAKGLAGVREIARLWGKTGRSIQECITGVLEAQSGLKIEKGPA